MCWSVDLLLQNEGNEMLKGCDVTRISVVAVKNYQLYSAIAHINAHCLHSARVHSTRLSNLVHLPYWRGCKWIHILPHVPMVLLQRLFIKHMAVKCIQIAIFLIHPVGCCSLVNFIISSRCCCKGHLQDHSRGIRRRCSCKSSLSVANKWYHKALRFFFMDLPLVHHYLSNKDINWRVFCQSDFI